MKIVIFMGVIGSGKDYQAKKLIQQSEDTYIRKYVQINFADTLKDIMGKIENTNLLDDNIYEDWKRSPGNRIKLQRLGTEGIRKYDPDFWVTHWLNKTKTTLDSGQSVVCSDCRFKNEVKAVLKFGIDYGVETKFYFTNYRSHRYDPVNPHESEKLAQKMLEKLENRELVDEVFSLKSSLFLIPTETILKLLMEV